MDLGRDELAGDTALVGRQICEAYSDRADSFLTALFDDAVGGSGGASLVALGGYGRRELSLQSDLDVLLLHDDRYDVGELAEAIWYPVWDTGVKLGHAVRTPKEALVLASDDLDSATALLQGRHLAGDPELTERLLAKMLDLWRKKAKRFLPELATRVTERHAQAGEVAFLLEPNLKEGRGGLRDAQSVNWATLARELLWDGDDEAIGEANNVLVDARVELHRRTGRPGDVLVLQEQDAVAEALGIADADELMRRVSSAARVIAYRSDDTWRRIESSLRGPLGRIAKRDRKLAEGIVLRDGEALVTADVDVAADPALPVVVAALAAAEGVPIHRASLDRLEAAPPVPDPWPDVVRDALVDLLGAGRPAIPLLESLDQHGLLVKLLPEWETVQCKPQRNAYHTYTVDRHLCEAVANAASLAHRVHRADLLLIGTWLHDIGKGYPGDHTEVGMDLMRSIGTRMALDPADVDTLVSLIEHHLLLPDVATRRDLDDPDIIDKVAADLGSLERLHLLHAVTEADSLATGPAAWGPWKADLVSQLVRRVDHVLGGGEVDDVTDDFPDEVQSALLRAEKRMVTGEGSTLTLVDVDRPGLFSRVTGVLALNGLDVLDANVATVDGWALEVLTVESSFGPTFSWSKILDDLEKALDGRLAIKARLADRRRTYAATTPMPVTETLVDFHPEDSAHATVIEVRAFDSVGILHQMTAAIADFDCNIIRARIQTLGHEVVDSFYVQDVSGEKVPEAMWPELRRAIIHQVANI